MPKLVQTRAARPVKTSLNLPAESSEILRSLADQRGQTLAEVIRRALQLEQYLVQVRDSGGRILIEQKDGPAKELVIF